LHHSGQTQAALIYTMPVLTAFVTLALVIHTWSSVRSILAKKPLATGFVTKIALLATPYLVSLVPFLVLLVFGLQHPDIVQRSLNGNYCNLNSPMPSRISALVMIICSILMVSIQVMVGVSLHRSRSAIDGSGSAIKMVIRVIIFTLLGTVGLGIGVVYVLIWEQGQALDLIMAAAPVSAFIVFGS